jgi:hypothetical protein
MWSYIIVLKRVSLRQIVLGIGLDYVYAVPIVIMSENGGMFTKKKLMTLTRSCKVRKMKEMMYVNEEEGLKKQDLVWRFLRYFRGS